MRKLIIMVAVMILCSGVAFAEQQVFPIVNGSGTIEGCGLATISVLASLRNIESPFFGHINYKTPEGEVFSSDYIAGIIATDPPPQGDGYYVLIIGEGTFDGVEGYEYRIDMMVYNDPAEPDEVIIEITENGIGTIWECQGFLVNGNFRFTFIRPQPFE